MHKKSANMQCTPKPNAVRALSLHTSMELKLIGVSTANAHNNCHVENAVLRVSPRRRSAQPLSGSVVACSVGPRASPSTSSSESRTLGHCCGWGRFSCECPETHAVSCTALQKFQKVCWSVGTVSLQGPTVEACGGKGLRVPAAGLEEKGTRGDKRGRGRRARGERVRDGLQRTRRKQIGVEPV